MSLDVYAPCPCGSGKKIKFCCIDIIGEMEKVERLEENNQLHMAVKLLDELQAKSPENEWVLLKKAMLLMDLGDNTAARELLENIVAKHPENSDAMALYAAILLREDGYEIAKPALYRALQKPTAQNTTLLSVLMEGIADHMSREGHDMSARQHLVLAIRLSSESHRQQAFMNLLEFDSDVTVPCPLRSVHELAAYTGPEEHAKDAARAVRLAQLGCFETAATIFEKLTEAVPGDARLHYNHAFCRAWDGDEVSAAAAFHKAAECEPDFERSVEYETIAQLLDRNNTEDAQQVIARVYPAKQVSRLLTLLDQHEQFQRVEAPQEEERENKFVATYSVLNRSVELNPDIDLETLEGLPQVLANLSVTEPSSDPPVPATVLLSGPNDELYTQARELFESVAAQELQSTSDEDVRQMVAESTPHEDMGLHWRTFLPAEISLGLRRQIFKHRLDRFVNEIWPNTPLIGLGGKAPLEVAGDPAYKLRLTAAVHVLDAVCSAREDVIDLGPIWERLQLDPPRPLQIEENAPLASLSPMQLDRLEVEKLSDAQLNNLISRAMLLRHRSFEERVLEEVLKRPDCLEQIDMNRIYGTLVQISRSRFDSEHALYWVQQAQEEAKKSPQSFELLLSWYMQELLLRLENPDDPELNRVLLHLWNQYGKKIPGFREQLSALVQSTGVKPPWGDGAQLVTPEGDVAGSMSSGGVWTPGGSSEAGSGAGGEKKLWIPGLE